MKFFITGATGYIGQRLALTLADAGHTVVALVRSADKAKEISHASITFIQGTLEDTEALEKGTTGCDGVFHLAAFARVWAPDPATYDKVNVEGTENVLKAAIKNNVKRVVFTSTAGAFGPSGEGPVTETTERNQPFFNEYEETKRRAEILCQEYVRKRLLEVVIVNPSRVYGPGLGSESNVVTRMVRMYIHGSWRWIPGDGTGIGNYVYVDDVVQGHLLASEKGQPGEIYLLGGENATYTDFFLMLQQISGIQKRLIRLPISVMLFASSLMVAWSKISGKPPLITPKWVEKYMYNWEVSSQKAVNELGYSITPLREGIAQTIEWLNKKDEKTILHTHHGRQLGNRQSAGEEVRIR